MNAAAEVALVGIEGRDGAAFLGGEELRQDGTAVVVEFGRECQPVISGSSCLCGLNRRGRGDGGRPGFHALARGLVLVTNNARDYADIPGLRIENWIDT